VSDALSHVLDGIDAFCGDPSRVTLLGHSAGAHLCAMALLHRAVAAGRTDGARSAGAAAARPVAAPVRPDADGGLCTDDGRMPALSLLAAGVYDIAKHYEYEESVRCGWLMAASTCTCAPAALSN